MPRPGNGWARRGELPRNTRSMKHWHLRRGGWMNMVCDTSVRVWDVAEKLNASKASASRAMTKWEQQNFAYQVLPVVIGRIMWAYVIRSK